MSRAEAEAQHDDVPAGFKSGNVAVADASIHYVVGGSGPAVVLIHGFPQDWSEFSAVMPRLAKANTVVAIDLRGIGRSSATGDAFDAATLARDVRSVVDALDLERPYIVGHDVGGHVAYAYALVHTPTIRGAMISETALPGLPGTDALDASPALWHIRFMQIPGVSEKLIAGRHDVFLGSFLDFGKFSARERARFLAAYARDDQMESMLKIYRAFPDNASFNASHTAACEVPMLFVTGDESPFAAIAQATIDGMVSAGFREARSITLPGSPHYLFADIPEAIGSLIEREAAANR